MFRRIAACVCTESARGPVCTPRLCARRAAVLSVVPAAVFVLLHTRRRVLREHHVSNLLPRTHSVRRRPSFIAEVGPTHGCGRLMSHCRGGVNVSDCRGGANVSHCRGGANVFFCRGGANVSHCRGGANTAVVVAVGVGLLWWCCHCACCPCCPSFQGWVPSSACPVC